MTGPGFSPPDLEKRLAFNVKVNELLGRPATALEIEEMRLCYLNGWTPEEYVRVMVYRAEQASPYAEVTTVAEEFDWERDGDTPPKGDE